MCGVAGTNRIRNEIIRGTTNVGELSKKVQESRLNLFVIYLYLYEVLGPGREDMRGQWSVW